MGRSSRPSVVDYVSHGDGIVLVLSYSVRMTAFHLFDLAKRKSSLTVQSFRGFNLAISSL